MSAHGRLRLLRIVPAAAALFAATLASSAAKAPTVDEIVERYVAARGGLTKIRSIETLRQTGRASAGASRQALVTRELKRPGRTRFEFKVQGVTALFVSDGKQGYKLSPFDGDEEPKPLSGEVVEEAAEQGDIEGPLADWKAKGHTVELVGHEAVAGRDAYKLKLTLKSGGERFEYIDVKTSHLVRSDSTRQVRGRPVRMETTFTDYKKTAGVLFPRVVEIAAAGRPQRLRILVDKVEVNPPLSDARFQMPGRM